MSSDMAGMSEMSGMSGAADMSVPSGAMIFHLGISDYFLFPNFVPQTSIQYFGALVFTFVLVIVCYAVGAFKRMRAAYGKVNPTKWLRVQTSALHTLHAFLLYLVMMLFMSFNVGVCLTILSAIFTGSYIWDTEKEYYFTKSREAGSDTTIGKLDK